MEHLDFQIKLIPFTIMKNYNSIIKKARFFLKDKKYEEALLCYKEFKKKYSELANLVEINEKIIEKKLNNSNNIKISVIIPIFNAEKYLRQCIESIINQSFNNNIEIIAIDDCSTDNSMKILHEFKEKLTNLRILINKHKLFAGGSRNKGIDIAKGEYIHFLDADDILNTDVYKKLYHIAHINDIDILRTKSYLIDSETGIKTTSFYSSLGYIDKNLFNKKINFLDNPNLFMHIQVAPWAGLFKTEFLRKNNIKFNNLYCVNDRSFFAETIFKAKSILFSNIYILNYRINNKSSLVGKRSEFFENHFDSYKIIEKISYYIPKSIRKSYLQNEIYDIIHWLKIYKDSDSWPKICESTKNFINYLRKSNLNYNFYEEEWYKTIIKIINNQTSLIKISVIIPVYNCEKYISECI